MTESPTWSDWIERKEAASDNLAAAPARALATLDHQPHEIHEGLPAIAVALAVLLADDPAIRTR
jgi:hypothetical protein